MGIKFIITINGFFLKIMCKHFHITYILIIEHKIQITNYHIPKAITISSLSVYCNISQLHANTILKLVRFTPNKFK